jgi:hypothetical protein
MVIERRDGMDTAHGRASSNIGGLCDILVTGMKQHIPDATANAGKIGVQ